MGSLSYDVFPQLVAPGETETSHPQPQVDMAIGVDSCVVAVLPTRVIRLFSLLLVPQTVIVVEMMVVKCDDQTSGTPSGESLSPHLEDSV
jgi:hypothetical protein